VDIRAINPARFTEWVVKQNKKLDYWCKDSIYTEYLLWYLKIESVNDALARAIEHSIDWEENNGHASKDYLRYGNRNAICHSITTGRISPWVIYNCDSGQQFLSEIDETQIAMIWTYIDADVWQKKFKDYIADQEYAKEILSKAGW
jgi:uroporphyrinogen-III decarboxylase